MIEIVLLLAHILVYGLINVALVSHFGYLDGLAIAGAFWVIQRAIASIGNK